MCVDGIFGIVGRWIGWRSRLGVFHDVQGMHPTVTHVVHSPAADAMAGFEPQEIVSVAIATSRGAAAA